MNNILDHIKEEIKQHTKQIALLIDPEKCSESCLKRYIENIALAHPDYIFVGGSQLQYSVEACVEQLKACNIPIILFPGNAMQLANNADALLLLSLLSGRNSEYLIGQHIKAASQIKESGIEVIPTGYLLIDGGNRTAVESVSHTEAIERDHLELAVNTALAGELLGMKTIYLEAGSGAKMTVPTEMIEKVKENISLPLIVGGGIKSTEKIHAILSAGADIIVIGNHFEEHPEDIVTFCNVVHQFKM